MPLILVVDDDEATRTFISEALTNEGYSVITVPDGAAALARIKHYQVALILLDTRMPVMDGWEFAQAYRQMPGPHAPIIVLTAALGADDIAEQIDAADFLAKPFDLDELLAIVKRYALQQ